MAKVYKQKGWKLHGDHWYYNERSKYGVRYMCAYCGGTFLGWGGSTNTHAEGCERRKAHLAEDDQ